MPVFRVRHQTEYRDYMSLRRQLPSGEIEPRTYRTVGSAVVRRMNGKDDGLNGSNDHSVVTKVDYGRVSVLFAADTSHIPWRDKILPFYGNIRLAANILLGSHHGSATFFDDPPTAPYEAHVRRIKPEMAILSVGRNNHGHPDPHALKLYNKHCSGSHKGTKLCRTDLDGNMKLVLQNDGWTLSRNQ